MKKILAAFLVVAACFLLTGCGKVSKDTVVKKIDKKITNCDGYHVEANLELINNDDSYKYDVVVSYKKKDNYRVLLMNKTNNHEQIILKNKNGVYVLSPSLNKSFKFQSNWPYDNSQGYLLQSVIADLKSDKKLKMKKQKDGYVLTSKVNYKNNPSLTHQEVIIDKNYNIKSVTVLDDNLNAQIKVVYKSIDMKAKFGKNYFSLEKNMEVSKTDDDSEVKQTLSEAIYPMYLPQNTYLDKENVVDLENNGSRIILTFSGDNPFMLVEQTIAREEEMEVIPTSGDIDLFMDGIAFTSDSSVSWISDNVEYYLVSSDLSKSELLQVARSVSSMPLSK